MQTKKYAPMILAVLAAVFAIIYAVKYLSDQRWMDEIYFAIAAVLFAGAALTSFIKNSNMKVGWYLYVAAFAFWMVMQFLPLDRIMDNIVGILTSVLMGLFIIVYLLDDEVITSFSYDFSLNKRSYVLDRSGGCPPAITHPFTVPPMTAISGH